MDVQNIDRVEPFVTKDGAEKGTQLFFEAFLTDRCVLGRDKACHVPLELHRGGGSTTR